MSDTEMFSRYHAATGEAEKLRLRNEIVEKKRYVAEMIAKKFVGRGVEYDDLLQVALLALIKGVERFDETKGLQFSTYITPTITGEIKNYFRDRSRLIHLPRKINELRVDIKRTQEELVRQNGRTPTAREIALCLNVSEDSVLQALEAGSIVSLDTPVGSDDNDMSHHEVIPSDEHFDEDVENRDMIRRAMKVLSEEEEKLIQYRYLDGCSQTETARKMGLTQMTVSRLERKALAKMKTALGGGGV